MNHFFYRPTPEQIDLLQWHVEQRDSDDKVERFIAIVCNPIIALETFDACVEHWPDKAFTCRHGSRVLKEYKPATS